MTKPKTPSNLDQEIESAAEAYAPDESSHTRSLAFKAGAAFVREKLEARIKQCNAEFNEVQTMYSEGLSRLSNAEAQIKALKANDEAMIKDKASLYWKWQNATDQIKALVEALDFYASFETYKDYHYDLVIDPLISNDQGSLARQVLEAHKKAQK